MTWNWQQPDWPEFTYDQAALEPLERQFLLQAGAFIGACKHIGADDQETLKIELIGDEAVKTSEIEGEILNRDSVQSSLRQQFGLGAELPGVKPAERGISIRDLTEDEVNSLMLGTGVTPELARRICERPTPETADALFTHVMRSEGGGKVDLAMVYHGLAIKPEPLERIKKVLRERMPRE